MSPDPTIPLGWDLAFYAWIAIVLAAVTVGVISTIRARYVPAQTKALWVVLQLLVPLLGTAAWFAFGYRSRRRRPALTE